MAVGISKTGYGRSMRMMKMARKQDEERSNTIQHRIKSRESSKELDLSSALNLYYSGVRWYVAE